MSEYADFRENRKNPMNELIYWIDREYVQWRALVLLGRELNEEEIERTTKFIEWGLSPSAFEVVDIAINETMQEKNDKH